jgi:hypothetical protein
VRAFGETFKRLPASDSILYRCILCSLKECKLKSLKTLMIVTAGYVGVHHGCRSHAGANPQSELRFIITMGNVCCGGKEESTKNTSFIPTSAAGVERSSSTHDGTDWSSSLNPPPPAAVATTSAEDPLLRPPSEARHAALAQGIVQATGRAMVSIHTRRTDRHYYSDQGFAAALAQHLQERMPPVKETPQTLPPAAVNVQKDIFTEDSTTPLKRRNLTAYLDQVSDAILEKAVPKPERLLAKAPPMMENLL